MDKVDKQIEIMAVIFEKDISMESKLRACDLLYEIDSNTLDGIHMGILLNEGPGNFIKDLKYGARHGAGSNPRATSVAARVGAKAAEVGRKAVDTAKNVKAGFAGQQGGVNLRTGEAGYKATSAGGKVGAAVSKAGTAVQGAAKSAGTAVQGAAKSAGTAVQGAAKSVSGSKAGQAVQGAAKSAGGGVAKAAGAVATKVGTKTAIGGAVALALATIYASFKIYKRFFSEAAKACGSMSGAEKTECMAKYKKAGKVKQMQFLQGKIMGCKGDAKCSAKIKEKIASIRASM